MGSRKVAMQNRLGRRLALIAAIWLFAVPATAIILGQIDDFQAGTLQGWTGGTSATNQPTGGPAGAGDRYVRLNSGGASLGIYNMVQWSGNYAAAGVTRVDIDLSNFGPDPVSLRLMIFTPGCASGAGACTAWTQTLPTVLPAGSGWVRVEFSLAEPDLTRVIGADSYAATIANVERLHLKHDPGPPDPPGVPAPVIAMLGVDNIVALPEPAPTAAFLAGAITLACFPRGRRGKRGN
jgi:hypothetical protein